MQHSDLERLLAEQGQQLLRQLYQDSVDRQAQAEVADEVVDAHGTQRTRKRTQQRELETIFGTVQVQRTGYGATGEASLHPLDAQLNLPAERYSLEVRRRAALEASKNSFDETVETLTRFTAPRSANGRSKNWSAERRRTSTPSTSSAVASQPGISQRETRRRPRMPCW